VSAISFFCFGDSLPLRDVGLDQAGRDAVDADALTAELARHRASQAQHAGLGGRIVRPAEDAAAALRRDGGDAHDRAGLLLRMAGSTACDMYSVPRRLTSRMRS
jgi:hypothetical protein